MKILLLSYYFEPDLSAGSFRMKALTESLKKRNIQLKIITTQPNRYTNYSKKAKTFERNFNYEILRVNVPKHSGSMLSQAISFAAYYKFVMHEIKKEDYDLVFSTSSRLFTAFLGSRVAAKLKIPLILDIRDIFLDTISHVVPWYIHGPLTPLLKFIEKLTFNKAIHINLVSKGFKSYFEKRFQCKNYSYLSNGIDSEFINFKKDISKQNTCRNVKVLTYAGNIGKSQKIELILPQIASKLSKNIIINVYGGGSNKNELIKKTKNLTNINIYDPVSRPHLLEIYQKSDYLFLHLDDKAPFRKVLPSKIFEYGAMNKKIVAGVKGYSREFIETYLTDAIVFEPFAFEEAVQKILQDEGETKLNKSFIRKFERAKLMEKLTDIITLNAKK